MKALLSLIASAVLVIAFAPSNTRAADIIRSFHSWHVISDGSGDLVAGTMNDAGNFLAFRCYAETQKCLHLVSANVNCENGKEYAVLINADSGSIPLTSVCALDAGEKSYSLMLKNYDAIHEILIAGTYIGFAVPMASGQFKVVRFDLDGSKDAMKFVEENVGKARGESQTNDRSLKNGEQLL